MEAFLRARGTLTSVARVAKMYPLPVGVDEKAIKVLAADERFELQDLGSSTPLVHMRDTPPIAETPAGRKVTFSSPVPHFCCPPSRLALWSPLPSFQTPDHQIGLTCEVGLLCPPNAQYAGALHP